jgi:hypothetical protein
MSTRLVFPHPIPASFVLSTDCLRLLYLAIAMPFATGHTTPL